MNFKFLYFIYFVFLEYSKIVSSNPPPSIRSDCPEKIKMEYGCCSLGCKVIYVDKDGSWGEENGQWCGCGGVSCSPLIQSKGYGCCSKYNCKVYWHDEDGKWGIDQVKKVWCGISYGCIV